MLDLKAQLGDYLDHVVERIDVDDIFDELVGVPPVQPVQPRVPRRTVPQWVYGVAAAAAVLIFVGGMAWLVRSGAPIDPVDQPTDHRGAHHDGLATNNGCTGARTVGHHRIDRLDTDRRWGARVSVWAAHQ